MMALPPLLTGAVKVTLAAVVLPGVAAPIVGTPGTPTGVALLDAADAAGVALLDAADAAGVTLLDAADAALLPAALVAVTVKV